MSRGGDRWKGLRTRQLEHAIRPFRIELGGKTFLVLPDKSVYEKTPRGLRHIRDEKIRKSVWLHAVTRLQELAKELDRSAEAPTVEQDELTSGVTKGESA